MTSGAKIVKCTEGIICINSVFLPSEIKRVAEHNDTGKRGEEMAADYLAEKGILIREKNWRKGYLEVDLIVEDGPLLVFVEVKTRSDLVHGMPEEAVTRKKEKHLLEAAEAYLDTKGLKNEVRFDIISVWESESGVRINHIREAFTGMG
jgi:putative endonuclease